MCWVWLHCGGVGNAQIAPCTFVLLLDTWWFVWVGVPGETEVFGGTLSLHGMELLDCLVVDGPVLLVLDIPSFFTALFGVEGD